MKNAFYFIVCEKALKKKIMTQNPSNQPRSIGEIVTNFIISSKEPLAKGYREYLINRENYQKGGRK